MADSERKPYGLAIGRLVEDYRDFTIMGAPGGFGYTARMRHPDGSGRYIGTQLAALECDGLAAKMDEARAGVIRLDAPDEGAPAADSLDQPLVP